MRRLSRSIFVLVVVFSLNTVNVNARVINDDQDPRDRVVPRIVRVIKQIIRFVSKPSDDGNQLLPPHP